MLDDYIPVGLMILIGVVAGIVFTQASRLLGPHRPTEEKLSTYESGMEPVKTARERFSVKFYMVAMLFIIFDMEIVFLYPWAVVFNQLKLFGLLAMGTFLVILLVGYFYAWKKGGLEWE